MNAPTDVRSGRPGSGPQTLKSKLGTPSAERSMPNTSQMTPNSKTARPSSTNAETLLIMAVSYRMRSVLPLLAEYLSSNNCCHERDTDLSDPDRTVRTRRGTELDGPPQAPHAHLPGWRERRP